MTARQGLSIATFAMIMVIVTACSGSSNSGICTVTSTDAVLLGDKGLKQIANTRPSGQKVTPDAVMS
jgi:hypothetical protein|tara:strand:- start:146 stop:346 length:201 start_codon:yes stop_codon:yes gene_type:complete